MIVGPTTTRRQYVSMGGVRQRQRSRQRSPDQKVLVPLPRPKGKTSYSNGDPAARHMRVCHPQNKPLYVCCGIHCNNLNRQPVLTFVFCQTLGQLCAALAVVGLQSAWGGFVHGLMMDGETPSCKLHLLHVMFTHRSAFWLASCRWCLVRASERAPVLIAILLTFRRLFPGCGCFILWLLPLITLGKHHVQQTNQALRKQLARDETPDLD